MDCSTARALLFTALLFVAGAAHAQVPSGVWFARAGASGDGTSEGSPFGSAAEIERATRPGDTILLLPSDAALGGGLALKPGQTLIGLPESGRRPVVTNVDSTRNGGVGLVLADSVRVWNVRVEETAASGLFGRDVSAQIDGVVVRGANRSEMLAGVAFPMLPDAPPHGGMVFVQTEGASEVVVTSSAVLESAGLGIATVVSGDAQSRLAVHHTRVHGGTRLGRFYDTAYAGLVRDSTARLRLDLADSEAGGRLTYAGRNVMVLAAGGAQVDARVERFVSGPTGQDGIVVGVQSPSEIDLYIGDSLVEGAGQMNVEGTILNIPPDDGARADEGRVSIEIERSTIRGATAAPPYFEDAGMNVWLGGSRFVADAPFATGTYTLTVRDSRILDAGHTGLMFSYLTESDPSAPDASLYDVVLEGNTIAGNGDETVPHPRNAAIVIHAPNVRIDARRNCWGSPSGLADEQVITHPAAAAAHLDASEPLRCEAYVPE